MSGPTRVALAGSTGSIGTQARDVLRQAGDDVEVTALGAGGGNLPLLIEQASALRPKVVAVASSDVEAVRTLAAALPGCEIRAGDGALASLAEEADVVVNGIVGFAGLPVTLATLRAGRRLGLANKESLVAAGPVVQEARCTPGAELIPVDSEHAALHQCLAADRAGGGVARLLLTASGGPFRGWARHDLEHVTLDDALAHPTWQMGPKITVDSSTLMNKGLEVIEAFELFGTPAGDRGCGLELEAIDVVVHPQSIVHSMVELRDGSTLAQLSLPDMRLPIAYALAFPHRLSLPFGRVDWSRPQQLDFEPPDRAAFGCLDLAYDAARAGGSAPAWLNAANEVAVAALLARRIRWVDVAAVSAATLEVWDGAPLATLEDVVAADQLARRVAEVVVTDLGDPARRVVVGAS